MLLRCTKDHTVYGGAISNVEISECRLEVLSVVGIALSCQADWSDGAESKDLSELIEHKFSVLALYDA